MTSPDLAGIVGRLRELMAQATPGPWGFGRTGEEQRIILGQDGKGSYVANVQIQQFGGGSIAAAMEPTREANAELIVFLRNNADALLSAAEALTQKSGQFDDKALEIAAKRMCLLWVGGEDLDADQSRHGEIGHSWFLGRDRYRAFTKRIIAAYLNNASLTPATKCFECDGELSGPHCPKCGGDGEVRRLWEALREAYVDIAWNEYNCGIERDGKWMDGALSDAEQLQHDMGLEPGWHDAQDIKDRIPSVVLKRLAALSAGGPQ